ncbi:restriction endonuclease subunit S [Chamaesiphon sp.]|uniref:restriction endonuclease subunit S n=1 Tax=Chamaesiphon sp. TaxID=2814140 RepID=UPI003593EC87
MGKVVEKERAGEKLPKGWIKKTIAELIDDKILLEHQDGNHGGLHPRDKDFVESGVKFVTAKHLRKTGSIDFDRAPYISKKQADGLRIGFAQQGDVFLAHNATVGAVGMAPEKCESFIVGTSLTIYRSDPIILLPHFLFLVLQSEVFQKQLTDAMKQTTRNQVPITRQRQLWLPLPPLPEQKRIVGILSDRLSAVEQARAATEAQLAAAKALAAAYLRQVFDSPEAQKWERKKLGDIALTVQNGIYKSSEHYGSGYPFLRMYNLKNSSWKLDFTTIAQVILDDDELKRFSLEVGDLLISRVNSFELVGKCGLIDSEAKNYVFENMLIRVRLIDSVDSLFIAQQMGYRKIREQIEAVAKQAIGQASINSTDIRNLELQVPPLEKQKYIAVKLREKTQQSENLQQSLQAQLDTINQLPAALLRQAFNGEL